MTTKDKSRQNHVRIYEVYSIYKRNHWKHRTRVIIWTKKNTPSRSCGWHSCVYCDHSGVIHCVVTRPDSTNIAQIETVIWTEKGHTIFRPYGPTDANLSLPVCRNWPRCNGTALYAWSRAWSYWHGPLTRYLKLRVRMRRECRERFPRHRG